MDNFILLTGEIQLLTVGRFSGFGDLRFFCHLEIFPMKFGVWEGLQSIDAGSEIHLDGFSAREVPCRSIFDILLMISELFRRVQVAVWPGIYRISGQVGQISFISVVWADPKSCALKNDADSWWYYVEISVCRLHCGQIRFLNSR